MGKIQVTDAASLDITGDLTLSCWAKVQTGSSRNPLVWKPGAYGMAVMQPGDPGGFVGGVSPLNNSDLVSDFEEWRDLQWHFFSMVYSDTNDFLKLYVDTLLKDQSTSYTQSLSATNNDLFFANDNNGNALDGVVDEVQIWSEARSQADLREDLRGQLTGGENNLEGLWQIDAGSGTTVADSAHGNDGTVTDGTWVERQSSMGGVLENPHSPFVGLSDKPTLNETKVFEDSQGVLRAFVVLNVPPPKEDADYHQVRYRQVGDNQWNTHEILENNTFTTVTVSDLSPGLDYEFGLLPYSKTDNIPGSGTSPLKTLTVTTAEAFILDDFEDGDISEYSGDTGDFSVVSKSTIDDFEDDNLDEYSGDKSDADTTSVVVKEGTRSLELNVPSGSFLTSAGIASDSGLSNYPSQGDRFTTWVHADDESSSAVRGKVLFGLQSESKNANGYAVRLRFVDDFVELVNNGTAASLTESGSATLNAGQWYQVEVDWGNNGDIDVTIFDVNENIVGTVSGNDSTHTSGGIGFLAESDHEPTIYFDAMKNLGSSPFFEGNHVLRSGTSERIIFRKDKILEQNNDVDFRVNFNAEDGSAGEAGLFFSVQGSAGSEDGYVATIAGNDGSQDEARIVRYDGGTAQTTVASGSFDMNSGVWYRITVEWSFTGDMTIRAYDDSGTLVASDSGTDTTYAEGGFGWLRRGANTNAFYDFARRGITP